LLVFMRFDPVRNGRQVSIKNPVNIEPYRASGYRLTIQIDFSRVFPGICGFLRVMRQLVYYLWLVNNILTVFGLCYFYRLLSISRLRGL
jgi:hypothetical protein